MYNTNMSDNFDINDFDINDFDDIRPPDKPIREILNGYGNDAFNNDNDFNNDIDNNRIFYEELEQCLIESQLSFLEEEKRQEEENKERKLICEPIRRKLEKIKGHDIANKEIYEAIFSVIEMWELCQIEYFETDKDMFDTIINLITSIRMTKEEHKFLINLYRFLK